MQLKSLHMLENCNTASCLRRLRVRGPISGLSSHSTWCSSFSDVSVQIVDVLFNICCQLRDVVLVVNTTGVGTLLILCILEEVRHFSFSKSVDCLPSSCGE